MSFSIVPRESGTNSGILVVDYVAERKAVTVKNLGPQTAFMGKTPGATGPTPSMDEITAATTVLGAHEAADFTLEVGERLLAGTCTPGATLLVTVRP